MLVSMIPVVVLATQTESDCQLGFIATMAHREKNEYGKKYEELTTFRRVVNSDGSKSVSYTHLTLPTIYSV